MEEEGLVSHEKGDMIGRKKIYTITPEGRKRLEGYIDAHNRFEKKLIAYISRDRNHMSLEEQTTIEPILADLERCPEYVVKELRKLANYIEEANRK